MAAFNQRTLKKSVECVGIGLHSGRPVSMRLRPAPVDHGVVFARTDQALRRVSARVANVARTQFATTLSENGTSVATTEHLMSALYALEIDNVLVELDGAEVPILDGSAAPFVYLVHEAGVRELDAVRLRLVLEKPLSVTEGGCRVVASPAPSLSVDYTIDFDHPLVGSQNYRGGINLKSYLSGIATARTFCFLRDVEALRRQGLALGGCLENAVVVGDEGVLNDSLRFEDEFVRHKVLDLVGDLALLGMSFVGHVRAERAGHWLHTRLVQEILARPDAWRIEGDHRSAPGGRISAPPVAVAGSGLIAAL
jgi:UDP-3-O-[3-hydroxymyristoyl] N-acetylglucosamine deacetylase